jgi:hypothetical protein
MDVTGKMLEVETKYDVKIQIFGDSITAGYGNMRPDSEADALKPETQNGLVTYAALACTALNADYHVFARSGIGLYTNPYGNTSWLKDVYKNVSPASKTAWDMTQWVPDIVVINVGTNDVWAPNGSNGNVPFSGEGYQANYVAFVKNLAAVWGKDVKFVFCSGMMETSLNQHMSGIRDALSNEGISCYIVKLPYKMNSSGHPTEASHRLAATVLERALNFILKENK